MNGDIASLLLNVVIVVLLAVTIGYCWMLNRRIRILQDSKSELAQLLKYFDESTQRASESIIALQTASKKIGENIQFRIDKANYLLEDLTFMIERGNKLASQMEAGFAVSRARSRVLAEQQTADPETSYQGGPDQAVEEFAEKEPEKSVSSREKTTASLEAVLERVVGRNKSAEAAKERPPRERSQPPRSRSKAEQELLDMIKAGMKG